MTQQQRPGRRGGASLGRGLSALFGEMGEEPAGSYDDLPVRELPVEMLQAGAFQPRRRFDSDALAKLTESVRDKGVLQPLLVRALPGEILPGQEPRRYEIVAGERRFRAAQAAGLASVPVVVLELDDRAALQVALIENLQRADLNPVEEAAGLKRLMEEFQHTQDELAQLVGRSRSAVANTLRLLDAPPVLRALVEEGLLSAGHARALQNSPAAVQLAEQVVKDRLSVRETEALVRRHEAVRQHAEAAAGLGERSVRRPGLPTALPPALERLAAHAGAAVQFKPSRKGDSGTVTIRYTSREQLEKLLEQVGG